MSQSHNELPVRVGFFKTVADADRAIRDLLAEGFTKQEIAVICPGNMVGSCTTAVPPAKESGRRGAEALIVGGAAGAALGGLALATVAVTGGAALLVAAPVLVGGGALAGGLSNLIISDGYDKGVGDYYDYAARNHCIGVGVEIGGENAGSRLGRAENILNSAGAETMQPLVRTDY